LGYGGGIVWNVVGERNPASVFGKKCPNLVNADNFIKGIVLEGDTSFAAQERKTEANSGGKAPYCSCG